MGVGKYFPTSFFPHLIVPRPAKPLAEIEEAASLARKRRRPPPPPAPPSEESRLLRIGALDDSSGGRFSALATRAITRSIIAVDCTGQSAITGFVFSHLLRHGLGDADTANLWPCRRFA
jgi:hypothetical protein